MEDKAKAANKTVFTTCQSDGVASSGDVNAQRKFKRPSGNGTDLMKSRSTGATKDSTLLEARKHLIKVWTISEQEVSKKVIKIEINTKMLRREFMLVE